MPTESTATVADMAQRFARAMQSQDWPAAADLATELAQRGEARPADALVGLLLQNARWSDASALLAQLPDGPQRRAQRRLAQNMLTLKTHRPELYALLVDHTPTTQVQLLTLPGGELSLKQTLPGAEAQPLAKEPIASHRQRTRSVLADVSPQEGIALLGAADGHALDELAQEPPAPLGERRAIFVIEPDAEVLLHCLMIHDWQSEQSPLRQRRFIWCVGPRWQDALAQALEGQPQLLAPRRLLATGLRAAQLRDPLMEICEARRRRCDEQAARVQAYYQSLDENTLATLLGPNPPRPPRVLLLSSRFTTVLHASSRDAQAGFETLGFQTQLKVEADDHLTNNHVDLTAALEGFKPDVVFCIDHLRYEVRDSLPAQLPFVCWIQDNLPNLTSTQAGQSIGQRDFVLGTWVSDYVRMYCYPERQCIAMQRLTRLHAPLPERWERDGDDLVYVSNHAHLPTDRLTQVLDETLGDAPPAARDLVRDAGQRIIDLHEQDQTLPHVQHVRSLLQEVAQQRGSAAVEQEMGERLSHLLFDTVLNTAYRHQGLRWASRVAEEMGLTLSIYGRGWEKHPLFAPHARGVVAYGQPLEELTRRSRINLMLEPFWATSHQRLLDGLLAGGLFLMRRRPIEAMLDHLQRAAELVPPHIENTAEACSELGERVSEQLDRLLAECNAIGGTQLGDIVRTWRRRQADIDRVPPHYSRFTFGNGRELAERVQWIADAADEAQKLARAQREYVANRYGYERGLAEAISQIRQKLAAPGDAPPCA